MPRYAWLISRKLFPITDHALSRHSDKRVVLDEKEVKTHRFIRAPG